MLQELWAGSYWCIHGAPLCYFSGAVAVASPCTPLPLSLSPGAYGEYGKGEWDSQ